jgi:cysteine synthase A
MAEHGSLGGIGWTRAVRVDGLTGPSDAEVWVKLEAANPTGSYKDRMALAMVRGAERSGSLRPGQVVVEVAARLGARCRVLTVQRDSGLKYLSGGLFG